MHLSSSDPNFPFLAKIAQLARLGSSPSPLPEWSGNTHTHKKTHTPSLSHTQFGCCCFLRRFCCSQPTDTQTDTRRRLVNPFILSSSPRWSCIHHPHPLYLIHFKDIALFSLLPTFSLSSHKTPSISESRFCGSNHRTKTTTSSALESIRTLEQEQLRRKHQLHLKHGRIARY